VCWILRADEACIAGVALNPSQTRTLQPQPDSNPARSTMRANSAVVKGAPFSEVKTNAPRSLMALKPSQGAIRPRTGCLAGVRSVLEAR
jgi:hypothetical protein